MCCSLTELIRNLKAVSFTKQILFFSPFSCCVRGEKRKRIQADAVTQLLCRMQSTMKEVRLINPAGMCECIRINIIIIISDITCSFFNLRQSISVENATFSPDLCTLSPPSLCSSSDSKA